MRQHSRLAVTIGCETKFSPTTFHARRVVLRLLRSVTVPQHFVVFGAALALAVLSIGLPVRAGNYAFDLDEDGELESNLQLGPCASKTPAVCLQVKSAKLGSREF